MKDYKKYWLESLPLVFPIEIEKFDYVIESTTINCPECHEELTDLRGKVYEAFDCVETDVVGLCGECSLVVGHRSRYYPKTGRCLMEGLNGWNEGMMIPNWLDLAVNFCRGVVKKIKNMGNFFKKWDKN